MPNNPNSVKTVLVTGSAGFIGSHLVNNLLAQGINVIGVDNFNDFYDLNIKYGNCSKYFSVDDLKCLSEKIISPYKNFQSIAIQDLQQGFPAINQAVNFLDSPGYRLYGLDLCDYNSLKQVFENHKITHIVHLAALAGVRPSTLHPILYQKNNGESTVNLLDLAHRYQVSKFVFASSSSVYGSRSVVPFRETEDISKPISPYAATKVAGEAMIHAFYNIHKIPSVCLRFFTVYGPGQRPDLAIHKFSKLIATGREIEIYGDGSAKRDFTYIADIMDGVLKAIDLDCGFEIFNLGEFHTTDVNTLVTLLENQIGKKALIKYCPPIPGDVPITCADISKSKSFLGYNPQTPIDQGLVKFVEWFKGLDAKV
jgi:UDP-glucuronate 4-epimerase